MVTKSIDSDNLKFIIRPSQFVNIGWFLLLGLSVYGVWKTGSHWWFITPAVIIYTAKWLIIKCWSFRFHEKTIAERKGVFSVLTKEIHYFRIKSVRWEQPFWLRIFGLSNVVLITSDPLIPMLRVYAIWGGEDLKDRVKMQVSKWRRDSTVKEQDIHPLM